MTKTIQAKHVSDIDVLKFIDQQNKESGPWMMRQDVEAHFKPIPPKVVLSKLRALLKKRLIDGCGCGCRGDFTMTTDGRVLLENRTMRPTVES